MVRARIEPPECRTAAPPSAPCPSSRRQAWRPAPQRARSRRARPRRSRRSARARRSSRGPRRARRRRRQARSCRPGNSRPAPAVRRTWRSAAAGAARHGRSMSMPRSAGARTAPVEQERAEPLRREPAQQRIVLGMRSRMKGGLISEGMKITGRPLLRHRAIVAQSRPAFAESGRAPARGACRAALPDRRAVPPVPQRGVRAMLRFRCATFPGTAAVGGVRVAMRH